MGVKSLWRLMKEMFPQSIVDCNGADGSLFSKSRIRSPIHRNGGSAKRKSSSAKANIHLFVDANSILHRNCYAIKDSADIRNDITKVSKAFLRSLDTIAIQQFENCVDFRVKSMYLALDGPPPESKLETQRKRRLQISLERSRSAKALKFNTVNLTTGSMFMMEMDRLLVFYAARITSRNRLSECVINGSRTAGEGETKVIQALTKKYERNPNDYFLIFSGDSDAIMQLLLADGTLQAAIYNRDQDILFTPSPIIEELASAFGTNDVETLCRIKHDLAVLLLMAFGNDHIPPMARTPFDELWDAYRNLISEALSQNGEPIPYLIDVQTKAMRLQPMKKILAALNHMPSLTLSQFSNELASADAKEKSSQKCDLYLKSLTSSVLQYRGMDVAPAMMYSHSNGPSYRTLCSWITTTISEVDKYPNMTAASDFQRLQQNALFPGICGPVVVPQRERQVFHSALYPILDLFEKICIECGVTNPMQEAEDSRRMVVTTPEMLMHAPFEMLARTPMELSPAMWCGGSKEESIPVSQRKSYDIAVTKFKALLQDGKWKQFIEKEYWTDIEPLFCFMPPVRARWVDPRLMQSYCKSKSVSSLGLETFAPLQPNGWKSKQPLRICVENGGELSDDQPGVVFEVYRKREWKRLDKQFSESIVFNK